MKKDSKLKACGYCHNYPMDPAPALGEGWLKCSKCGATTQLNPTDPGQSALVAPERLSKDRDTKNKPRAIRRPRKKAQGVV